MKKVLIVLLLLVMVLPINITGLSETSSKTLTYDDAVSMIANNSQIKLMDEQIGIFQKQYDDAVTLSDAYKSISINDLDTAKKAYLDYKTDLYDLNNEKQQKEDKIDSIKKDIKSLFVDIETQQQYIGNTNTEIANLDKTIDQIKLKIKLGKATNSDLTTYTNQEATLKTQINSYERAIDQDKISLRTDIGMDQSQDITIVPVTVSYSEFNDINIDNRIQNAAANSYDMKQRQENIDLTNDEYSLAKMYKNADGSSPDLNTYEREIEDDKSQMLQAELDATSGMYTTYYNLMDQKDKVSIDKLTLDEDNLTLGKITAQYKLGKENYLDYLNADLTVRKDNVQIQDDQNKYMLMAEDFLDQLNTANDASASTSQSK